MGSSRHFNVQTFNLKDCQSVIHWGRIFSSYLELIRAIPRHCLECSPETGRDW
jgi:hypothetical protein